MDKIEFQKVRTETLSGYSRVAIAFGAIYGYTTLPFLRFVDPSTLYIVGFGLAVGAALVVWGSEISEGRGMLWYTACGGLIGFASLLAIGWIGQTGNELASELERRCAVLEADMVDVHPVRTDSRELFIALGCRAQAKGELRMPSEWV